MVDMRTRLPRTLHMVSDKNVQSEARVLASTFSVQCALTPALSRDGLPARRPRSSRSTTPTGTSDAAGNSGGVLLDSRGRLIGINTAIASPSGASNGVGFAIPIDAVKGLVDQVRTPGL